MSFPANFTCEQTFQDVAPPAYGTAQIIWSGIMFCMLTLNTIWLVSSAGGVKGLQNFRNYKSTTKNFWFLEVGLLLYFSYVCTDYLYVRGHIEICFIFQVMFAYFLDSMIVMSAVNWSGMNNIVGRKPVPPAHYVVMRNLALVANGFVQLTFVLLSMRISTNGDKRYEEQSLTWYDGNLSVCRTMGNVIIEFMGFMILLVEGRKLKIQIGKGGGGNASNSASAKILKYIYTASVIVPFLMAFRLGTQVMPRMGMTMTTSFPVCSNAGAFMDATTVMAFVIFLAFFLVMKPSGKKKNGKVGAATTTSTSTSSAD
ncbi:hypothetical protein TrCOL_g7978 [Triparma columacea]|uniref:Uncharacterized protein n=1 Tax=Triparma columacea TaxID=722753 RepID=A0A9W7GPW4_9STRA|nr:hypothetical protein TrCOL_g7978 [Triparma columacea]